MNPVRLVHNLNNEELRNMVMSTILSSGVIGQGGLTG